MAPRYERKLALLAKAETIYGVDATPTGAANAMLATDVQLTPLDGDDVSRNLLLPYMGGQGTLWAGVHTSLGFKIELAGSGAAGTPPAYGPLLRACGLAETITADTQVDYQPVSEAFESTSIYLNLDGVNHVMLGARGNVQLGFTPREIPYLTFAMQGLLGPIADVALPALTLDGFIEPLIVNKVNTPTFTLHGTAAIGESFSADMGNQVEGRFLIGEDSIQITGRNASASAVIEATSLATKNWFAIAQARTEGVVDIVHGTVAGNIAEFKATKAQPGRPTYGATQGIRNMTVPFSLLPDAGDDEFVLTFK